MKLSPSIKATSFQTSKQAKQIITAPDHWTAAILLSKSGHFSVVSVAKILGYSSSNLKTMGHDVGPKTGVIHNHKIWYVDMPTFAAYYFDHLSNDVKKIDPSWDANQLLRQKGVFYLSEIIHLLPFKSDQLRYQGKKSGAKETMGLWRDGGAWHVDMPTFSSWVSKFWRKD